MFAAVQHVGFQVGQQRLAVFLADVGSADAEPQRGHPQLVAILACCNDMFHMIRQSQMFHLACRIAIVGNALGITYPHPRVATFSDVIDDVAA